MSHIDRDRILSHLSKSAQPQTKRDLARQLGVKGAEPRRELKELLKELEEAGAIIRAESGGYALPHTLPAVGVVEITGIDTDGDVLAFPMAWDEDRQGPVPRVEMKPAAKGHPALTTGDRVLASFDRQEDGSYIAKTIRRLDAPQNKVAGVIRRSGKSWFLEPADKKARHDFEIPAADLNNGQEGDLALAETQPKRKGARKKQVRILQVFGHESDPKTISLLSIHEAGLHTEFTSATLSEAAEMGVPDLKGREDLRPIPLVTIDGADARDFDDAVFAEKTDQGGFHLIVAIADVAHYVRPGSALDEEAQHRGNSTYFPDRVVPMLPEKLSNDLCSLRPHENRACLAVHLWVSAEGKLENYKFVRGLMKSAARLTYEQVQAARDGLPDDTTGPLLKPVIAPLYEAYEILRKAREQRGALDLDLPERQIVINENNEMSGVKKRERLDAHMLIEEFMVTANVAAAKALDHDGRPAMYRAHEQPDTLKIDSARAFVEAFGLSMPKGQVMKPVQLNRILTKAAETPYSHLISEVILRSQSQARYETENKGHFGLALSHYTHFTSPIRRYADLEVHRCLIDMYGLGAGGMNKDRRRQLPDIAEHISNTERTSMQAERSAVDRFTAAYLSSYIGAEFEGTIKGVTRFGLFIELDETGADGLLPIKALPRDYYDHHEDQHALIGRKTKRTYRLGAKMTVKLSEANGLTGSTILLPVNDKGADIPGFSIKSTGKPGQKKKSGPPGHYKGKKGKGGKSDKPPHLRKKHRGKPKK